MKNTSMSAGYNNGEDGVGANSTPHVNATRGPLYPHQPGEDRQQGETPGTGSVYSATLNERPNRSSDAMVNSGPSRGPSIANRPLNVLSMSDRSVPRVGR